MFTPDSAIKEVDKLNIFKNSSGFNIPSILRSIKNYEKNFYAANANHTKQTLYPLIKGLENGIKQTTILTADNVKIDIWDINPFGVKKYVIFCEGISSEKSNPLQQNAYLKFVLAGWGVLAFDYRGKGKSSGQFTEQGSRIDVSTVFNYLQTQGISAADTGVIGHSMGSAVAADFCAGQKTAFTILINPFSKAADMAKHIAAKASMPDIIRRIINRIPAFLIPLQNRFDNEKAIKRIKSPLCIIHTKDDSVIPVEQARKLVSVNKGKNISYTELESGCHELNDEKIDCCLDFMQNQSV